MKLTPLLPVTVAWMLVAACAAPDAAPLWKARGSQALDNLEKMDKHPPNKGADNDEKCEAALETAYALHAANPTKIPMVTFMGAFTAYHLFLNSGGNGVFEEVYLYDRDDALVGVKVLSLPRNWQILHLASDSSVFVVVSDLCHFGFSYQSPLQSTARAIK